MTRPRITPGSWESSKYASPEHTPQFGVYMGSTTKAFAVLVGEHAEANSKVMEAIPDLLKAVEGLVSDKYLSDPINEARMAPLKEAMRKAGYTGL